jgi:hypothetical protein
MLAMYDHKGYKITVRESEALPVAVFDPNRKREPALYKTTSLDEAMRWIDKNPLATP